MSSEKCIILTLKTLKRSILKKLKPWKNLEFYHNGPWKMPKYDLENLEKTLKNEGKFGGNPDYIAPQ